MRNRNTGEGGISQSGRIYNQVAMRLDIALAERHSFTRNKAQQLIEVGLVSVNAKTVTKVSYDVSDTDVLDVREDMRVHWVSRSAQKLHGFLQFVQKRAHSSAVQSLCHPGLAPGSSKEKWIPAYAGMTDKVYGLCIENANCLDVGSSTGGFTQVLLEHGAAHVDAVDVGTDQLHDILRNDPRVTSYEQTDIRDFVSNTPKYDIIVCDASFISLVDIIHAILDCASDETHIILLFKPQFEVGREHLRKT
jgi:23S rRNA (cytidine1920-2'-O)/16S rRNA (cytidine1409-2'-O)-methyltransferase